MPAARPFTDRGRALAAVAIVVATLVLRAGKFGNPLAGLDEQFYLLVGDRIWSGALPYVDIWDRKPVGLFLLFAGVRLLPGDGVVAAQVAAAIFAGGTAWCVALLARRATGWAAAAMAGVLYLAGLNALWGTVAQAPVFYNLFVAAAALLSLRGGRRAGAAAMLLAGVAIQVKTNAVFEGTFFGLWLVAATWVRTRSVEATARRAAVLAAIGAAPTLVVIASYAALGALPEWWGANVASVVAKGRADDAIATATLWESASLFAPFALAALGGLYLRTRRLRCWSCDDAFLTGWVAVAAVDFVAIGGYWPHYALPLLLACCPLAAPAFAKRWGPVLFVLLVAAPLVRATWIAPATTAAQRAAAARVLAAMPDDVRTRCLFIYDGPPIYYQLTRACLVSRFAYPAHLSTIREAAALGVDPAAALRAAMAARPGTVMTTAGANWVGRDAAQEAIVRSLLARDYRPVARLPYGADAGPARLELWRRRDLAAR